MTFDPRVLGRKAKKITATEPPPDPIEEARAVIAAKADPNSPDPSDAELLAAIATVLG